MKNAKVKIYFFSVALVFTTLFTACQQEEFASPEMPENPTVNVDSPSELELAAKGNSMILPYGFSTKESAEIEAYFDQLSEDEIVSLIEHTRIGFFLEQSSIREQVEQTMTKGQLFSDIDLSAHLTATQLRQLGSYTQANFEAYRVRTCGNWKPAGFTKTCRFATRDNCMVFDYCTRDMRYCTEWPLYEFQVGVSPPHCWSATN